MPVRFRHFYRIVENEPPTADDFISDHEAGKGLASQSQTDLEGRSVYDELATAVLKMHEIRKGREKRGIYVPPLKIARIVAADDPAAGPIYAVQQGKSARHFQLFGDKHSLAAAADVVWREELTRSAKVAS